MTNVATRAAEVRDATTTNFNTASRVGQVLLDINNSEAIDPCDPAYGTVGSGLVDDSAALLLAITAGIAAGVPVAGRGRTYGIAGNLTLPADAWLQDIKFKQLTPAAGTVRTITSAGGSNIHLVRVTVDRNGDGTAGTHQVDAGIYLSGGDYHRLVDCEVFGDDIGVGIVIYNSQYSQIVRGHVHDIGYNLAADPGNDRVQGIWLVDCTGTQLISCTSHDFISDFGGGPTVQHSRAFTFTSCTGTQVGGCRAWNADQGFDSTGGADGPNTGFQFSDSFATDCRIYGFKFANTARDGQVDNCTTERCGLSGFVASGPTGPAPGIGTCNILFTNSVAYDTGGWAGPGVPEAGGKAGFRVSYGGFEPDTLLGIRFIGCKAHDRQAVPTMTNGFLNDVAANVNGNYNECVDCTSIGHISTPIVGMHEAHCDVTRVLVQSIPTGVWTAVAWTADVDLGAMHDTAANNEIVFARRRGRYQSQWGVVFQANGTGQRGVRILRNGGVVAGSLVIAQASTSGQTALQTAWTSVLEAGDSYRIEVFQDSGIALNLQTDSGGVVEQVG